MTLIVETGSGVPGANSYVTAAFVTTYLTTRNRATENSWSTLSASVQAALCVAATDYIDKRWGQRFKGVKYRSLVPGRAADGTILFGGVPVANEEVVVGLVTYRFVAALAQENDVLRGSTAAEAAANLAAAVNGTDDGTSVHEDTVVNYSASAAVEDATVTLTALQVGENGNLIAFTTDVTGATISGSGFLAGGLDQGPQPLMFPRAGCTDRDGRDVVGVPLALRQATAEYAVRAAADTLDPDPTTNVSGAIATRIREVMGPLESDVSYGAGGFIRIHKPYPAADQLLADFVASGYSYR